MAKLTKDERISAEYTRLSKLFVDIDENKRELVEGLLQNASFMLVTLEDLQAIINEEGAVIVSTNGNGFQTYTEHPAQKSYNTMINRFTAVAKQLTDLVPEKASAKSKLSELMAG